MEQDRLCSQPAGRDELMGSITSVRCNIQALMMMG